MNEKDNSLFEEYETLLKAYRSGDENAFSDIYEKSKRFVYATCYGILNNEDEAADAMQETYISVFINLDTFDNDRMFIAWIKQIAAHKSLDMCKKRRGNISYDDAVATDESLVGDYNLEDLPDYYITEKVRRKELERIMREELSEVQYQTIHMYYYDELSVEKIAELMGCPEGTVKTRLKASRIRIKEGIRKYEKENKVAFAAVPAVPFLTRFFNVQSEDLNIPSVNIPSSVEKNTIKPEAKEVVKSVSGKAAKATFKHGFLSTLAGKIITGLLALAVIISSIAVVSNIAKKKPVEPLEETPEDRTEETDEALFETAELTPAVITEQTETTEDTPAFDPVDIPLDQVPELEQLQLFARNWCYIDYDSETFCNEDFWNYLIHGQGLPLSFYYPDIYEMTDSDGYFYRWDMDKICWIESNIMNLSVEQIEQLNNYLYFDEPNEYDTHISDGYIYYYSDYDSASYMGEITSVSFFDGLYYVTVHYYDMYGAVDNNQEGYYCVLTMELKEIDGNSYWSIIKSQSEESFLAGLTMSSLQGNGVIADYAITASSLTLSDFGYDYGGQILFDLVYINDDDVPELVASVLTDFGMNIILLYTYTNGEVIRLGEAMLSQEVLVSYTPEQNLICSYGDKSEAGAVWYYTYVGINDSCDDLNTILEVLWSSYDYNAYDSVEAAPSDAISNTGYLYRYDEATSSYVELTGEYLEAYQNATSNMIELTGRLSLNDFLNSITS